MWRCVRQAVVQKWGNSLGFRIPSFWAKDNNVRSGSKIEVIAEKGKMVILPQKKSLDDMLAFVTPDNIHSEISTGYATGKEEW
ncbi:AbrB/MazE/SpoVT family DNA-binding domain-containing protein [Treponema socranskii]|nr:AbrB/MazE/SpoVT family DNA-binding domain-containing protein [Treponema socranskii]